MHRIGKWQFEPEGGELVSKGERRRLEHRAARTLELLCNAGGAIVSRDTLIAQVWGGRSLSENSISVVIGQLRRALDDDPREPRLIETVPKRGYRLRTARTEATNATRPDRTGFVLLMVAAVVALVLWLVQAADPAPRRLQVAPVVNATGSATYDPLARATGELLVAELSRRGYAVHSASTAGDEPRLAAKLVMWDGAPSLSLTVRSAGDDVLWSAMTSAAPGRVPAGVAAALNTLEASLPTGRGTAGQRVARGGGRG